MSDHGFWLRSPDVRVVVRLQAAHESAAGGDLPREATLPDAAWNAAVLIGENL